MDVNDEEQIFESLLDFLRRARGFDFTGYKRSSLQRRIRKRMQVVQVETFSDYLDYLQVYPQEFFPLFNTILINVTGFFRDVAAWNYLSSQIIPHILNDKTSIENIRVWSAGCASGEEAYTLAILLAEALGSEEFRRRVKIYATDVDEEALNEARLGSYSAKSIESIPEEIRERYFEVVRNRYVFRSDLRRAVIFGRHDLVQDAPISRLDLLVCRNALMYFNAETQGRILNRFHFALNNSGFLFLGKAEMLLTYASLFNPVNLQHRIFSKILSRENERQRLLALSQANHDKSSIQMNRDLRLWELGFEAIPIAQIIIDASGNLVLANKQAQSTLNLSLQDIGRPFQDLEVSYRPIELRSQIEQVYSERRSLTIADVVRHLPGGIEQYFDIQLTPLQENGSDLLGVNITFTDVSRYHELQSELQRANQELETANEELQSSNEELETTNEELQSTNEELETTNEELQSTNEELETMNEELQSTNEELQTINDELRQRTNELNQTNAFLNSILASLRAGVVVVDRHFQILSWNNEAENLWGLRAEEVQGQSFLGLDIGLPIERLREPIRNCLAGDERQEIVIEAINRRGQTIQCRISFNPLIDTYQERLGVILLMEDISST